ncbi:hypothetical protein IFM89_011098 [Coptis chinensis]|uniref:RNase H type-1 domain-containing protein n=1 Tax=Coptis chinensis TaxID=261450 RepID=A0A835M5F8_9MAGN|nr:hypothetical protein IFM89_011098 [Coptis chinensis]
MADMKIMRAWNLLILLPKAHRIRPCWWTLPEESTIKINCDGSTVGNPGSAGIGSTFRDASIESVEIAVQRNWKNVWVESDSVAAVSAFGSGKLS